MPDSFAPEHGTSLPFAALRQVDLLCDDFERAWQDGTPRSIRDYLRSADPELLPSLREELLKLELHLRSLRGEHPRAEEYLELFPECAGSVPAWLHQALATADAPGTVSNVMAPPSTVEHAPAAETPQSAAEAPAAPLPPVLGEYEVLGPLGAGGMGEVYRARHRRLGKLVALKVLRRTQPASDQALARFRREMEAVGQLDHPHLVEAHDAGEQDGVVYLVLKLIEGIDLRRLVEERGPLPVAEACDLVRQAALGLQYLHERGLVHRDVKPANLMRTPAGTVKVLDLGLARWRWAAGGDELTVAHMVLGTPDYLAPEQIENAAGTDIRADLYGLGATLFYLLTGKAPFAHHDRAPAKLKAHGTEPPPDVRSLRPDVPPDLAGLVARLLAKQPEQRFATPREAADALAQFATTAPTADRRRPLWRAVLAVAAGLLLLPLAVWATLSLVNRISRPNGRPADPGDLPVASQAPADSARGPAAAQPLKVLRLDVEHFAKVDGQPRGVLGKRSFATRCDDQVTVTGELSAPAYCYLIDCRPDGTEELCFPEKEDESPPLTDRPRYPSESVGKEIGLNEGPGLCAFVLVARSKPLPPYAEWRPQAGDSPWRKCDALVGVVWRHDGTGLRAHTPDDPEARGKGQEARGVGELPRLVEWLRQRTEADAVSAVAFAVQP
jgi:serine/threonine protein kinase